MGNELLNLPPKSLQVREKPLPPLRVESHRQVWISRHVHGCSWMLWKDSPLWQSTGQQRTRHGCYKRSAHFDKVQGSREEDMECCMKSHAMLTGIRWWWWAWNVGKSHSMRTQWQVRGCGDTHGGLWKGHAVLVEVDRKCSEKVMTVKVNRECYENKNKKPHAMFVEVNRECYNKKPCCVSGGGQGVL